MQVRLEKDSRPRRFARPARMAERFARASDHRNDRRKAATIPSLEILLPAIALPPCLLHV